MTDNDQMTRAAMLAAIEQEHARLQAVLPRFSDEQWHSAQRADGWTAHDVAAHLADSNYGLALLVLGEIQPTLPLKEDSSWMDADAYNEQRRAKNTTLPRDKVASRLDSALGHVRRAIETVDDVDAPGPYGPVHTKGLWLRQMVRHTQQHRSELEEMLDE